MHFSLTDAMGHVRRRAARHAPDRGAAQRAASGRRARRASPPASERARRLRATRRLRPGHRALDLRADGHIVNAGHPLPLRCATGVSSASTLRPTRRSGPWRGDYRVQRLPLEPGDRLLFFTDGMLERNTTSVDVPDMVPTARRCIRGSRAAPHPSGSRRDRRRAHRRRDRDVSRLARRDPRAPERPTPGAVDFSGPRGAGLARRCSTRRPAALVVASRWGRCAPDALPDARHGHRRPRAAARPASSSG